jgi:hypothetical protein
VETTCVHDLAGRLRCAKCREAGKRPAVELLQLGKHSGTMGTAYDRPDAPPRSRWPQRMLAHLLRRLRVGTIGKRAGVPNDVDQGGWQCSFYPTSHSGWHVDGTAATFDRARTSLRRHGWASYLPDCTEADFQAYRAQRDWTPASTRCGNVAIGYLLNNQIRCVLRLRYGV